MLGRLGERSMRPEKCHVASGDSFGSSLAGVVLDWCMNDLALAIEFACYPEYIQISALRSRRLLLRSGKKKHAWMSKLLCRFLYSHDHLVSVTYVPESLAIIQALNQPRHSKIS